MNEAQRLGTIALDLCRELGLEPEHVRNILVEPRSVTASIYELNDNARKFIKSDGEVALRTITRPLDWPEAARKASP